MIGIDSNVLVYAHCKELPQHALAVRCLERLATGVRVLALPWPCVYEFLKVVTHPRLLAHPSTVRGAGRFLRDVLAFPGLLLLSETGRHRAVLEDLLASSGAVGNVVHDAHIAALLLEHGVSDLLTADRDFRRFPSIRIVTMEEIA